MALHTFTAVGMVCSDPVYKQISPTQGVVKFRLKAQRAARTADGGWVEQDSLWLTVEAWGQLAENIRRSVPKLAHVIVVGTLVTQEYDNERGEHRTNTILKAQSVGLDLNRYLLPEVWSHSAADVGRGEHHHSVDKQGLPDWVDASLLDPRFEQRTAARPSLPGAPGTRRPHAPVGDKRPQSGAQVAQGEDAGAAAVEAPGGAPVQRPVLRAVT